MADCSAVVLSGGGAKGAYALGVLRALATGAAPSSDHRALDPEIFTGTSVGAFNATILASQPGVSCAVAVERLVRIWRRRVADCPDSCGNGVFRLRGLPVQDLDPACFFPTPAQVGKLMEDFVHFGGELAATAATMISSRLPLTSRILQAVDAADFFDPAPLRSLLRDTIDFGGLERSGKTLSVVASHWRKGTPRIFQTDELLARRESLPILASMAIPGIFPPVWIDGEPYVDGGLSMNTPIRPAIRAGAQVVHVIYLDPRLADCPPPLESTFDTLSRLFAMLAAEQMKSDLRKADRINRGLDLIDKAERGKKFLGGTMSGRALASVAAVAKQRTVSPREPRRVEIHVYRPSGGLARGADLLDFHIDHIDSLIEQGYRDAAGHDCAAAECSLYASDALEGVDGARCGSTPDEDDGR